MKTPLRWLIVLVILAASLACQLVERASQEAARSSAPEPEVAPASAEDVARLEQMLEPDDDLTGAYIIDLDQDGTEDNIYLSLPLEHPLEGVSLSTSFVYAHVSGSEYAQGMLLLFNNQAAKSQRFTHTFVVPQEFATRAEDLNFDPQPDEIQADSTGLALVYRIELGQAAVEDGIAPVSRRMQESSTSVVVEKKARASFATLLDAKKDLIGKYILADFRACDKLAEPSRSQCILDVVEMTRLAIAKKDRVEFCDHVQPVLERQMCYAIARGDIKACLDGKLSPNDQEFCKGYYIVDACRDKSDWAECRFNLAIEHKSTMVCQLFKDRDLKNDCMARVTGNKEYCDDIVNTERRDACQRDLDAKNPKRKVTYKDPDDWFNKKDGEAYCARFQPALPGYRLTDVYLTRGNDLACHFLHNSFKDEQWLEVAAIRIHAYDGEGDARDIWDEDHSQGKRQKEIDSPGADHGLNYQGDRYFMYIDKPVDGKTNYYVRGARLFDKTVIIDYLDPHHFGDKSSASWDQIERIAIQLIEEARAK